MCSALAGLVSPLTKETVTEYSHASNILETDTDTQRTSGSNCTGPTGPAPSSTTPCDWPATQHHQPTPTPSQKGGLHSIPHTEGEATKRERRERASEVIDPSSWMDHSTHARELTITMAERGALNASASLELIVATAPLPSAESLALGKTSSCLEWVPEWVPDRTQVSQQNLRHSCCTVQCRESCRLPPPRFNDARSSIRPSQ
jgi:hypothetical protein